MKKNKTTAVVIVVGIAVIAAFIILAQPKKIKHTYKPATDITEIRECVKKVTGSPKLNIEALSQDQQMLADVYRFCLKTVENIEETLQELAQ